MTFEWWFAYLLTSIILSLSPGSGAINTMTTSLNHGYRGAVASIAGLQAGLGIHIVLVGVGLGTLFSRSVIAFEVLKWAGAAYLIWLGIQQWRAAGAIDLNAMAQTQSRGRLFKRAVFVNLTNPKASSSGGPFPTVRDAKRTPTDAVHRARCNHYCSRHRGDDRLRHAGAAYRVVDQRTETDESVE